MVLPATPTCLLPVLGEANAITGRHVRDPADGWGPARCLLGGSPVPGHVLLAFSRVPGRFGEKVSAKVRYVLWILQGEGGQAEGLHASLLTSDSWKEKKNCLNSVSLGKQLVGSWQRGVWELEVKAGDCTGAEPRGGAGWVNGGWILLFCCLRAVMAKLHALRVLADEIYRKGSRAALLSAAGLWVGERVCVCVWAGACVNDKKGWGMSCARLAPFPSTNCWQSTHGGCASVSSFSRPPRPRGSSAVQLAL